VITKGVVDANPTNFSYIGFDEEAKEDSLADVEQIEAIFDQHHLETDRAEGTLSYFVLGGVGRSVLIAKVSDYNSYAELLGKDKIELTEDELLLIDIDDKVMMGLQLDLDDELELADGTILTVNHEKDGLAEPNVLPEVYASYL